MSGTPFQEIYDKFQSKTNQDYTGKEGLVFEFLKTALSKSYKVIRHSIQYDSMLEVFNDVLDLDEIDYIGTVMAFEAKKRRVDELEGLEKSIGTKDFKELDYSKQLNSMQLEQKQLKSEIYELSQNFNTYSY
jgi:hypothetical protein